MAVINNETGVEMGSIQVQSINAQCLRDGIDEVNALCPGFANEPLLFDLYDQDGDYLFSVHEDGSIDEY